MRDRSNRPIGFVIWEGPSRLDSTTTICVVITNVRGARDHAAKNTKTGDLAQVWIIPTKVAPSQAAWAPGASASVCGDCPFQARLIGSRIIRLCYVNMKVVDRIYFAYKRNRYPKVSPVYVRRLLKTHCQGLHYVGEQSVRTGAWGDPAAVPLRVWRDLLQGVKHHPGYTHQHSNLSKAWQVFFMASTESLEGSELAWARGWRTFRIAGNNKPPVHGKEIMCPHYTHGVMCERCGLCNGSMTPGVKNIVSHIHGIPTMVAKAELVLA